MQILGEKGEFGGKSLDMTSEGWGEMFEGDFADTCAEKIQLVSMGGQVNSSSLSRQRNSVFIFGLVRSK